MTRPLQPHKGASETLRVVVTDVHGLPLQPHKGASETLKRASSKIEARLLQPHKGASETVPDCGHTATNIAVLHK